LFAEKEAHPALRYRLNKAVPPLKCIVVHNVPSQLFQPN
jgi:hypothetical protein